MAHHRDYDGVYFTLQSLRLYQDLKDCEILIVDNDANSEHGKAVKALVDSLQGDEDQPGSTPVCPVVGTHQPMDSPAQTPMYRFRSLQSQRDTLLNVMTRSGSTRW
jgi:hypothetical protein